MFLGKSNLQEDTLEAKDLSLDILQKGKSGSDFASLANQYTMDPSNQGDKGGDLGWFKKGRMVKPLKKQLFKLQNEIIGPILSRFGYHVIHVRDKRINEDGNDESFSISCFN